MFNLGFSEILIIAALILIFFGAEKMPEVGRAIARAANEFKRGLRDLADPAEEKKPPPLAMPAKKRQSKPPRKKAPPSRKKKAGTKKRRRAKLAG